MIFFGRNRRGWSRTIERCFIQSQLIRMKKWREPIRVRNTLRERAIETNSDARLSPRYLNGLSGSKSLTKKLFWKLSFCSFFLWNKISQFFTGRGMPNVWIWSFVRLIPISHLRTLRTTQSLCFSNSLGRIMSKNIFFSDYTLHWELQWSFF